MLDLKKIPTDERQGKVTGLVRTFLNRFFKKVILVSISILLTPLKLIIKKKNVVILQSRSRQVYCDNTRYLYECLSQIEGVETYWVTDNHKIKQYIKNKGWNYITWHNPIKMIEVTLKAKVVIDNGDGYFDAFNITKSDSVFKISLLHGSGPKATISRYHNIKVTVQQILNMNKFDYVNFTSKHFAESLGKKTYFLPNEKIINFGYPRCDSFFDTESVRQAYKDRSVLKSLGHFNEKDKVILYTPTWRPYKYRFPLSEMPGFLFNDFNKWLQSHGLIFFYTVHANLFPEDLPKDLDRIIFIDSDVHPLFDINELMLEVDILFNDYSTTSTEFSILERPQIFYMPDYEYYNSEKCFIEPYRDIMPGQEVFSYDDFKSILLKASLEPESYVNEHQEATRRLQKKYYNIEHRHSAKNLSEFVLRLL